MRLRLAIYFLAIFSSAALAEENGKMDLDHQLLIHNVFTLKKHDKQIIQYRITKLDDMHNFIVNKTNIFMTNFMIKSRILDNNPALKYVGIMIDTQEFPPDVHASKLINGQKQISINLGWIDLSALMADAFAYDQIFEDGSAKNTYEYSRYLVKSMYDGQKSGSKSASYKRYCSWRGFSDCILHQNDEKFKKKAEDITSASTAFVFGHEVAHIVLGHLDNPLGTQTVYERELAADKYAADLMRKSGIDPRLAAGALSLLSTLNPDIDGAPVNPNQHPPGICRIEIVERDSFEADFIAGTMSDANRKAAQAALDEAKNFLSNHPECSWKPNEESRKQQSK